MNTALTHRPVEQSEWSIMREQSAILVKTGFLPEAIRTPEQAVAIMLKGRELGIPAMYALSNIAVIKGKPVANAELMLALIYRDHGDNAIRFKTSDNKQCTVAYRRRSWTQPETYTFSIEDAKQAGLLGNQTWSKYPQAMLRARCVSAVARMAFADTIGGLYTPEELGATVAVSDEGEVITVADTPPPLADAPRLTANPPTNRVLTPDTAAAKAKLWQTFDAVVRQAKALGIKVQDAELLQANEQASEEEVKAMGKALRKAIEHKLEDDDESGSFVPVAENVELFPNGVPA
jgi:hypothetical protein